MGSPWKVRILDFDFCQVAKYILNAAIRFIHIVLESLRFEGEEYLKKVDVLHPKHPKPKRNQPATWTVMDANDGVDVSVTCVCWNMLILGHVENRELQL